MLLDIILLNNYSCKFKMKSWATNERKYVVDRMPKIPCASINWVKGEFEEPSTLPFVSTFKDWRHKIRKGGGIAKMIFKHHIQECQCLTVEGVMGPWVLASNDIPMSLNLVIIKTVWVKRFPTSITY